MGLYCSPSSSSGAERAEQQDDADSERARLPASPGDVAVASDTGLARTPDIERSESSFGSCGVKIY